MTSSPELVPPEPATASEAAAHSAPAPSPPGGNPQRLRLGIAISLVVALLAVVGLYFRAASRTNQVALSHAPKPVSVVKALSATFRPTRSYVGTTTAWNVAKVGPQYVSAYLGAVLVRPGATVKKGQVLATLDCRNTSAASKAITARAKALEERQSAVEHETQRTKELTAGGFASANEVEQLSARAASEKAEVESLRASMVSRNIEVDDCILRAPFDGEVADRFADPGAYVRPGNAVVTLIDRATIRITADVPESDFTIVAPGTLVQIEVQASGAKLQGAVSRRAPAADESTRTVHFEIDVPNREHALPTGTTAQLTIEVGEPQPATTVPLRAAAIRGDKANVFVVDNEIANRVIAPILGERNGLLYLAPSFRAGTVVVLEGRALLDDKDRVTAKESTL